MLKGYFDGSPKSTNTVGSANVSGTRFQNISNPYSEMPRTQTPWDRLLNWFGFRSGYDKAQEQYNLAGAEYNAQLEQLASEEAYNSPSAQAARMRAAGLNPDLTGVSGEPASEFDNQQTPPDISAGTDINPLDVIGDIGSGVLSAITGTVGIMSDFNMLKRARIALDSDDLDFADKMLDFMRKSSSYMTDSSDDSFSGMVSAMNEKNPTLFHSSIMANRFNRASKGAANSLFKLTNQFKNYDEFAKAAESLGSSMSQPYFTGFGSFTAQDIASFLKPISKAQIDLILADIRASNAAAYKNLKKDSVEGDAYAKLDESGYSDDLARSIQAGTQADTSLAGLGVAQASENLAATRAENSINQLTITRNKIYERMMESIESIPDRGIGSKILKFFLTRQLSQGINPLKVAGDVAGVANTVSNAQLNAVKAAKAAAALAK